MDRPHTEQWVDRCWACAPAQWWHRGLSAGQGPNNFPRTAPWGSRDPLPSDAQNSRLQNAIDQLFRPSDTVPGGTAAAVREENATGQPVQGKFHTQKAQNYLRNLQSIYRSGGLSEAEESVVAWLVDDLVHALLKCPS